MDTQSNMRCHKAVTCRGVGAEQELPTQIVDDGHGA